MSEEFWTRGELARRAGVKVATIRFYERRGLLADAFRSGNGYHHYDRDALRRLQFIRRAQELGFSLNEIAELLDLWLMPEVSSSSEVWELAQSRIRNVREKIADLQRMEAALRDLIETCRGEGTAHTCPILAALEAREADSGASPHSPGRATGQRSQCKRNTP